MSLTRTDVDHVARLARLSLSDEEKERMRSQLSAILDSIALLNEVDVSGVPITSQVTGLVNVFSPDVARPSLSLDEVLSNAPAHDEQLFRVKAIFE
jgi:aspartyl-tRNA(Asn)/glutamyl-tRNA(Gln) amidotransferase subunit C